MVDISGNGQPRNPAKSRRRLRVFYTFIAVALLYVLITGLVATVTRHHTPEKRLENEQWVSSSRFWLDRQLCRWLGCCGTFHMLNHFGWTWSGYGPSRPVRDFSDFWHAGEEQATSWDEEERRRRTIPDYVFEYAPYVHLSSDEKYWPSDIAEHLVHVTPFLNHSEVNGLADTIDLANLAMLNDLEGGENGTDIFLHSDDNMEDFPAWLSSEYNIPPHTRKQCRDDYLGYNGDGTCGGPCNHTCSGSPYGPCCSTHGYCGYSEEYCGAYCNPQFGLCHGPVMTGRYGPKLDLKKRTLPTGGESGAPVLLIVVPKDDGIVDAFWFFFYSYNLGKRVLNIRFGNHVGDWEHTMVRFKHGVPTEMFLSAHSWGAVYTYDALEKYLPDPKDSERMLSSWANASLAVDAKRPVVFSAEGSHAMYPTPDYHSYVAPFGILHDDADRGPLWDPARNAKSFMYDVKEDRLRSSILNPDAPVDWFHYAGHWGDRYYMLSDPRQYRFMGEYHYITGPLGPKFKNLAREHSCIIPGDCKVHQSVGGDGDEVHVLHEHNEASEDGD